MFRKSLQAAFVGTALAVLTSLPSADAQMLSGYRYDFGYWSPTTGYTPYNIHSDYYYRGYGTYTPYQVYPYQYRRPGIYLNDPWVSRAPTYRWYYRPYY